MKTLYFVQHGSAHPQDVDPTRSLSEIGIDQVCRVAAYLKDHHVVINKIYHSGKFRAQQTARLFSETLAVNNIAEINTLNPNDNPALLINQLTEDAVMYVGHLPNIANVVTELIGGEQNKPALKFQNAAVACIEIEGDSASVKWFITSGMC
ncbi:MAG: phosphohistidine phosphatase [Psychromonas sp.]|jgi:phosphohistidine phosphatase|uniref:phosphohistidine phosphatase SixA n=1 Tax=Psychromonas sp. TaxID=1884585 RepID=UPI0039E61210